MKTLLIDGDEWAYKAAHSGQRRWYLAKDGDREVFRDQRRADLIHRIGNNDWELEDELEDLGLEPAIQRMEEWLDTVVTTSGTSKMRVFLTGSANFRFKLASILPYKGNRDHTKKPIYLQAIRDIIIDKYKGESVDYLEADDLLSINQTNDTIIVTQDKDLNMVPGLRYYTNSNEIKLLEEPYCSTFFYAQILMGDATDNIPGLSYVGEKTAFKMLQKARSKEELYNCVVQAYSDRVKDGKHIIPKGKKKGDTLWETDKSIEDIVWEIGNLLWMRRSLGEDSYWYPNEKEEEYLSKESKEV